MDNNNNNIGFNGLFNSRPRNPLIYDPRADNPPHTPAQIQEDTIHINEILEQARNAYELRQAASPALNNGLSEPYNSSFVTTVSNLSQGLGAVLNPNPIFQGEFGQSIFLEYVNNTFNVIARSVNEVDQDPTTFNYRFVTRAGCVFVIVFVGVTVGVLFGPAPVSNSN